MYHYVSMNAGKNIIPRRNFIRNVIVIIQYNYFSESFCQQTPKKMKDVSVLYFFSIFQRLRGVASPRPIFFFFEKNQNIF